VATKTQCIIFLISFFCVIKSVSATEQEPFVKQNHLIVFPTVSLYPKIPDEVLQSLLGNVSYRPKAEGNVLAVLKDGDMVRVKPKDKDGHPEDTLCYKDSPKKIQYDWIVARDWLCVEVVSSANQEAKGKIGWIHRLSAVSLSNLPEAIPITFYTQDFLPFTECQEGKPAAGVGVEVVKRVCDAMRIPKPCDDKADDKCRDKITSCRFLCADQDNTWERIRGELTNEKGTGLFLIPRTEKTEQKYFLFPVLETEYGFFTLKSSSWNYADPLSLKGKKIDAYGPSDTFDYFKQLVRNLTTTPPTPHYSTTDVALDALNKGEIEILYSNKDVAERHAQRKSLPIRYAGRHQPIKYYVGLSKETPKVIAAWFKNTMQTKKVEIDELLKASGLKPVSQ